MSEPAKEQLEKWRSEFEKEFEIDDISLDHFKREGSYDSFSEDDKWEGYLAAKKSDFEEIKTLKEQLAEACLQMNDLHECLMMFKRKTNGSSMVRFEENSTKVILDSDEVMRKTREFLEKQDKENKTKKTRNKND